MMGALSYIKAAFRRALHVEPDPVPMAVNDVLQRVQVMESQDRLLEDGAGRVKRAGARLAEEADRATAASTDRIEASDRLGKLLQATLTTVRRDEPPGEGMPDA
jgi:hypothetical protein